MKIISSLVNRAPNIKDSGEEMMHLSEQVRRQGAYPAGHYYSPIPSAEDVLSHVNSRKPPGNELNGINLNEHTQKKLINEFADFYNDLPFPNQPLSGTRYYYGNEWFRHADAIILYAFLRKYKPSKIIEIGSGFSSAVILDTVEIFFSQRPEITFIEPYPERLINLFRDGDRETVRLIDRKLQDVPLELFLTLESGDLLFVDSSHVVKCNSDVQLLLFEILPLLKPGVIVHFHDVFYPFDYPTEWLKEGRYWNENYFLRAFLSYNSEWSIQFFNTYVNLMFADLIKEKMPLCTKGHGGSSLYLQRVIKSETCSCHD
jgi:predicted O-methyltransferase YrrM